MWVYIPIKDYSAMQWPCPSGFHVPSKDEWDNIYTAYTGLWLSWGTNFSTYLKLPLAWGRLYNTLNYSNRGLSWNYWTVNSAASNTAKYFLFDTSNIFIDNNTYRSYWYSIRSIKDTPVVPDNNWTTLYAGAWDAGIFHDTTNWLISISSNGTTWYTIADKNLWATTVYNYWDTLSENNCGKVYQRWNNYWFSWDANYNTSQITQSSTKVDVSTYWPWNYYSSSTWITVNPRQNSTNDGYNLRWWVTGVKSMSELKNAYIGEYVVPYLCFTANTAGSTVKLNKIWSPTAITLETSTDLTNWSTYTFWNTITLSNIWDKVYFRNTSTSNTAFSTSYSDYYQFVMTWSIESSGNTNYLINKNWTDTVNSYCYYYLFYGCDSLTSAPKLPATTLNEYCYRDMFINCTNITTLPKLPATILYSNCYRQMFHWCTKIKLSTAQTWTYQTPYRIPSEWTWTVWTSSLSDMFASTWWTFTWTPTINTTYYTSNTVV